MILSARSISWGHRSALQSNVSFSLNPGETLVISGPNGSGKTSLLRVIAGILEPLSGSIEVSTDNISYLPQMQNRATHLPYTLNDVLDGISDPLVPAERRHLAWNQASGGERQRTLLARTLRDPGDLLLLDEPFNHLDESASEMVQSRVLEVRRNHPALAIVLVSHFQTGWLTDAKELKLAGGPT